MLDDFEQFRFGLDQVVVLVAEEVVAFLEFLELLDGIEVDRAHGIQAALDVGDDDLDEIPVRFAGDVAGDFEIIGAGGIDDHGGHVVFGLSSDSSPGTITWLPLRACRAFGS